MKISIEIEMWCNADDVDRQNVLESISDSFGAVIDSGLVVTLPDSRSIGVFPIAKRIKEVKE